VDFDIHGGRPMAPFGFAPPIKRPSAGASTGDRPDAARPVSAVNDANAAMMMDAFSHPGRLPPVDYADVAKSTGIGLVNGLLHTAGLIGESATGFGFLPKNYLVNKALRAVGAEEYPPDAPERLDWATSQGLQHLLEDHVTGPLYQPRTRAGRYAETIGEFAPLILGGAGWRAGRAVLRGAASAAAARQGTLALGKTLARDAVLPGAIIQTIDEALPDSKVRPTLKKIYSAVRYGLPMALAAKRYALGSP
jgi:hypothetical protein